ncbi:MAG TPA: DUF4072 domain-containing protein, partial [Burkholderiaceae bacterium]|nr:DUF4072 domain-containing protein [Burkholderiaceae bacterium]
MNLILQGLHTELATVERIAALAGARQVTAITAHAYRCEQVDATSAIKEQVATACLEAELDCTWLANEPRLADFKLLAMD